MNDRLGRGFTWRWAGAVALAGVLGTGPAFAGAPLPPLCTNPLSAGPVLHQFDGASTLDRFGYSVAFGDVNGDGAADMIVGAVIGTRAKSGAINRAGYVKVFDGTNPATVLYTFNGYHDADAFGWRVAAGDVNGDGKADVVVTALRFDLSRRMSDIGRITIFDRATGTVFRTIDGETSTEQLGEALALVDVNGDGKAELFAGAWAFDPAGGAGRGTNKNNGIVRLYDGATGAVLYTRIGTERAEGIQDEMGRAIAFGDVDGDGVLDVALGAGGGPGYVEVMQGPAYTNRLHLFRGDLSVGNEDQFGRTLAIADLNGDGKGEIIAGAHVGDGGGLGDSGWVRVFDGATGTIVHQFNGTASPDHFGIRVATGDVNGDGQTDVIVGAEWGTLPGTPPGSGYVRVHDGATGAVLAEVNGSCDFADQFNGDHLGFSLAVHDVNGDGKVNILAGAPDGDAGGLLDAGFVRLYQDF
jgi:hypothetical protein